MSEFQIEKLSFLKCYLEKMHKKKFNRENIIYI